MIKRHWYFNHVASTSQPRHWLSLIAWHFTESISDMAALFLSPASLSKIHLFTSLGENCLCPGSVRITHFEWLIYIVHGRFWVTGSSYQCFPLSTESGTESVQNMFDLCSLSTLSYCLSLSFVLFHLSSSLCSPLFSPSPLSAVSRKRSRVWIKSMRCSLNLL